MYTDCKDPSCMKCKQVSKGQSSVEENQSKIPECVKQSSEEGSLVKTEEEIAAKDLLSAVMARGDCLTSSRRLKEEVHFQINALISVLRERELDLCIEIERAYSAQVQKIDHDLTVNCVNKVMKRNENKRPPSKTNAVFDSDFNALKRRLKYFGQLKYDAEEPNKKPFSIASSALPSFEVDPQTTFKAKNATPLYSASPVTLASLAERTIRNEGNLKKKMNIYNDEYFYEQCCKMSEKERQLSRALSNFQQLKTAGNDGGSRTGGCSQWWTPYPKEGDKEKERKREELKRKLKDLSKGLEMCESTDYGEAFEKFLEGKESELPKLEVMEKESELPKLEVMQRKIEDWCEGLKMVERTDYREAVEKIQEREKEREKSRQLLKFQQLKMAGNDVGSRTGECSQWWAPYPREGDKGKEREPLSKQEELQKEIKDLSEFLKLYERTDYKEAVENFQEAKELHKMLQRDLQEKIQTIARKDEPETLSAQIRKRFGTLANRAIEGQKDEGMAYPPMAASNFEGKVGKDNSSEEGLKLRAKLPVSDIESDKITSQSSASMDSLPNEEDETDSSWDEDDIEIITRIEADSILSDCSLAPPLPPKNRFKFGGRSSRFASLFRKKGDKKPLDSPRNSEKSESSAIAESESHASCAVSSCGNTEVKENPSFNRQPDQKSSSLCLVDSKVEGLDNDPTLALRSSFTKYLEKCPGSEWLAPGKTCEERVVPIFVQEPFNQVMRLPPKNNQKMASDWLYSD